MEKIKIDVFMASFPRNDHSDLHVINSALSILENEECDTLTISLSEKYSDEEIEKISLALSDERVALYIVDDAKHSNEKLRFIYTGENDAVALIDDDCTFDVNYLKFLYNGLISLNGHVSLHGAILNPRPIRSYYADRQVFRGLTKVVDTVKVDICSSCFTMFRRSWHKDINNWYTLSSHISMDDLFISGRARKRNIPCYVLKHDEGFVKHKQQLPDEKYVFSQYTKQLGVSDKIQTDYCNKNF